MVHDFPQFFPGPVAMVWPDSGKCERRTIGYSLLGLIFYFIHFGMRLTGRNDVFRKNKSENRGNEMTITIIERELYYIFAFHSNELRNQGKIILF